MNRLPLRSGCREGAIILPRPPASAPAKVYYSAFQTHQATEIHGAPVVSPVVAQQRATCRRALCDFSEYDVGHQERSLDQAASFNARTELALSAPVSWHDDLNLRLAGVQVGMAATACAHFQICWCALASATSLLQDRVSSCFKVPV